MVEATVNKFNGRDITKHIKALYLDIYYKYDFIFAGENILKDILAMKAYDGAVIFSDILQATRNKDYYSTKIKHSMIDRSVEIKAEMIEGRRFVFFEYE
jgi:hypothetical protein